MSQTCANYMGLNQDRKEKKNNSVKKKSHTQVLPVRGHFFFVTTCSPDPQDREQGKSKGLFLASSDCVAAPMFVLPLCLGPKTEPFICCLFLGEDDTRAD